MPFIIIGKRKRITTKLCKETLLLGYNHNREGLFNHQLMGLDLGLENEGRGLLRSPTVINKAHKSELQVGLTQNEDNQTNLREKDCGPSKNFK